MNTDISDVTMILSGVRYISGLIRSKSFVNDVSAEVIKSIDAYINKTIISTAIKYRKTITNEKNITFSKEIIKAVIDLFIQASRVPFNEHSSLINMCQAIRTVILSASSISVNTQPCKVSHIKGDPNIKISFDSDD